MSAKLKSSAPHIQKASTWDADLLDWGHHMEPIDGRSKNSGRLLFKGKDGQPEAGIWIASPGSWKLYLPSDEMHHFVQGKARYTSDDGDIVEITSNTVVHFEEGWSGTVEVFETTRSIYMLR